LFLYAESDEERSQWIGAIRLAVQGGKGDAANVFAAAMKPKKRTTNAPLTEEEASIRLQKAVRKYRASKKSQGKVSSDRKYRFEQQKRDMEAVECRGPVSRPVRCFKKLNTESEYQERWVWMDLSDNKLYWAKKNPIEGGNDLPPVRPPPAPKVDISMPSMPSVGLPKPSMPSMGLPKPSLGVSMPSVGVHTPSLPSASSMANSAANAATKAAVGAAAGAAVNAVAGALADTNITGTTTNEIPVVKISSEQIEKSGAKFLEVKGYILLCKCTDKLKITRSGKDISCCKFALSMDPNNVPTSLKSTGKILLGAISTGTIHTVEIYVPDNGSSEGSSLYYADVMRRAINLSKSS